MTTYISIGILIIFIILQIFDAWTTWEIFKQPGAKENNKLMAWLMGKIGVLPALILFKTAMLAVIVFALWEYPYWQVQVMALGVCVVYLWAVVGNYKQL